MNTLTVQISNPETLHTIAETAKRQGMTPEKYALELLETAILSQQPFEVVAEPFALSFDESEMSEDEFDALIEAERQAIWNEKHVRKECPKSLPALFLTVIFSFKELPIEIGRCVNW